MPRRAEFKPAIVRRRVIMPEGALPRRVLGVASLVLVVLTLLGAGADAQTPTAPTAPTAPAPPPADESPLGYTSRPTPIQTSPDFVPILDRWRLGFPDWNRYERRIDAPYVKGRWWDPYNQNVLKGDYPVIGQKYFLSVSAISDSLLELRRIPLPSNVSAADPG